ncbi:alkaline phosphatase synthesis sensor protein PhoR [bacterium BMS3Abin02]|nr:alkaline phosphatase synthesis sensor protein PhoR [bacterium BMS3Abin02]GBE21222.1 alkaline phosphatase synthesis sensor protein PhoR [bacterium BMS3Bbin01]HDH27013.1 HAMP domain-containing histidine kinase [Actinomycetota bacterium]HDL49397.1 HAMP domain-containing histidine kinase [Actinomycetota bacterium]
MLNFIAGTAVVLSIAAVIWALRSNAAARTREAAAKESAERARQMKDEFVSMVSHELRTPLTSIAGFAEALRESWRTSREEEVDEFLDIIRNQAQHLHELVEDILVLPRLQAGRLPLHPEEFELTPLAHEVVSLVSPPGEKREAAVAIPGGVMVNADRRRVFQVLRNLFENAVKYGGDQVLIEGSPYGRRYLVVVSDNGPGIQDEEVDRMFVRFEQRSKGDARSDQGIGLGLPIALQLAQAMGGDLWYEHRFPTGSRFCFTIALAGVPEDGPEALARHPEELRSAYEGL